jgi:hypothetical protein
MPDENPHERYNYYLALGRTELERAELPATPPHSASTQLSHSESIFPPNRR